jgi:tRNA (Thr-GGU) A37 N-methylase
MTTMAPTIPLPVIGVVRSRYAETEDTPIQARLNPDAEAVVEIGEQYWPAMRHDLIDRPPERPGGSAARRCGT